MGRPRASAGAERGGGGLLTLVADGQVIQVEWQALAAFGSILGGAVVTAAKLIGTQLQANADATAKRHEENRADAREARDENRQLSQTILSIQSETARTLAGVQAEVARVVERLDRIEGHGSKAHQPLPAADLPRKK